MQSRASSAHNPPLNDIFEEFAFSAFARMNPSTSRASTRETMWRHSANVEGLRLRRCLIAKGIDKPAANRKNGKTIST